MLLKKTVQMVTLFLEFPALQFRQILNGIDIVKGIPILMEGELARIKLLQQLAVGLCHAAQITGDASFPGVCDDGIQRRT